VPPARIAGIVPQARRGSYRCTNTPPVGAGPGAGEDRVHADLRVLVRLLHQPQQFVAVLHLAGGRLAVAEQEHLVDAFDALFAEALAIELEHLGEPGEQVGAAVRAQSAQQLRQRPQVARPGPHRRAGPRLRLGGERQDHVLRLRRHRLHRGDQLLLGRAQPRQRARGAAFVGGGARDELVHAAAGVDHERDRAPRHRHTEELRAGRIGALAHERIGHDDAVLFLLPELAPRRRVVRRQQRAGHRPQQLRGALPQQRRGAGVDRLHQAIARLLRQLERADDQRDLLLPRERLDQVEQVHVGAPPDAAELGQRAAHGGVAHGRLGRRRGGAQDAEQQAHQPLRHHRVPFGVDRGDDARQRLDAALQVHRLDGAEPHARIGIDQRRLHRAAEHRQRLLAEQPQRRDPPRGTDREPFVTGLFGAQFAEQRHPFARGGAQDQEPGSLVVDAQQRRVAEVAQQQRLVVEERIFETGRREPEHGVGEFGRRLRLGVLQQLLQHVEVRQPPGIVLADVAPRACVDDVAGLQADAGAQHALGMQAATFVVVHPGPQRPHDLRADLGRIGSPLRRRGTGQQEGERDTADGGSDVHARAARRRSIPVGAGASRQAGPCGAPRVRR
jgi:hypothetical protein